MRRRRSVGNAKAIESSDESLAPGSRLGSYEVIRPIAEGGMGVVYEARHTLTGVHRAVKIIRGAMARSPDFRARFLREATIASSLRHPNLVETSDPIEVDGMLVLPMELLHGRSLSARLGRDLRLSPEETAAVVVPVAQALSAVHAKGIIHRDLKPANVIVAEVDGRLVPKVLDFGVARDVEDDEQTRTGQVIGSAAYMAPEQAEGRRDLDARIDQFALGVIAYRCLTGRPIYESDDTGSVIAKLIRNRPFLPPRALVPEIPDAVEAVVLRALNFDRDARYPDLAAFGAAFTQALVAPPPPAVPASVAPAPATRTGGTRLVAIGILIIVTLGTLGGVAWWSLSRHATEVVSTPLAPAAASPPPAPPPPLPEVRLAPLPTAWPPRVSSAPIAPPAPAREGGAIHRVPEGDTTGRGVGPGQPDHGVGADEAHKRPRLSPPRAPTPASDTHSHDFEIL